MANVEPIPQVRTYTMNHPPLAPLESQANDHPAAGIHVGDEILDEHIAAASQQQNFRTHLMLYNQANPLEVVASKKREASIVLESVSTVPIGQDWARDFERQMMASNDILQQGMRGLQDAMNANNATLRDEMNANNATLRDEMNASNATLQQGMNASNATLRRIENDVNSIRIDLTRLSAQTARNSNRNLLAIETIVPIPNNQGQIPPPDIFPRLQADIGSMEEAHVNELLEFYGILPARRESLDAKKGLLCRQLGFVIM
jgi:Protein of unknown function (DUF3294)